MLESIENIDVSKYDSYTRYHAMNDFSVFVWCVFYKIHRVLYDKIKHFYALELTLDVSFVWSVGVSYELT